MHTPCICALVQSCLLHAGLLTVLTEGVAGVCGAVGLPNATPATLLEVPAAAAAAAPVAFMLPALPPMQLPKLPSSRQELSYWKNLPQYSQQENGTLVISFPILSGQANSQDDAISQVVTPNGYTISEGSGYGYTSGTATTASTSTCELSHQHACRPFAASFCCTHVLRTATLQHCLASLKHTCSQTTFLNAHHRLTCTPQCVAY